MVLITNLDQFNFLLLLTNVNIRKSSSRSPELSMYVVVLAVNLSSARMFTHV